jgi:hypothetical protein
MIDIKKSFHSQVCHNYQICQRVERFEKDHKSNQPTMPLSRPTPPRSLQPQNIGLSLLNDDDRLSSAGPSSSEPTAAFANDNGDQDDGSTMSEGSLDSRSRSRSRSSTVGPYDFILEQALASKLELETVRDDLIWLQVQNCRTLDALCMAVGGGGGALDDEDNDKDDDDVAD